MYYTWSGWWLVWIVPMFLMLWVVLGWSGRRAEYWRYGTRGRYLYGDIDDGGPSRYGWSAYDRSRAVRKHRNRGPRNYQRSDARIREDICDRLMLDDELDPSAIEVQVANGEVSLSGTVATRLEKRIAEQLAEWVAGVTDVDNRLKIGAIEREPQRPEHAVPNAHA